MSDTPLTIAAARTSLQAGEISALEVVSQALEHIKTHNDSLNAFLEVFADEALEQARNIKPGDGRPLAGIPIAIKDMICTTEGHTTAASRILKNFRSPYDATVIKRLKNAGAIVIGKANCDEFAMGASNEYSAFGPVKNPWDITRVAGGSSGGPIAAVAAAQALGALGTDTGGSTRMPANFCNTVGLRPTYGRISRFGVIAYASSFDQVGPTARTVADTALLLEVVAGSDPFDATSAPETPAKYTAACGQDIAGLTIGIPEEFFTDDVDPAIQAIVQTALHELENLGARTKNISLSLTYASVPTYYLLVKAEASSNLARYDGLRYGKVDLSSADLLQHYTEARGQHFGSEVKRSILMGTYALSAGYVDAWYKQASKMRTLIRQEVGNAFADVDVIAGPVSPMSAFPLGSKTDDPLAMYLVDLFMEPASVAGVPAISVPCGFVSPANTPRSSKSEVRLLPVGLQLIAPAFRENLLFQVGHAYEQAHSWWKAVPPLPSL